MNRRLLLIVLPLLLVISGPAVAVASTNSTGSSNTSIPQVPKTPTPPSAVGCYYYSSAGSSPNWESVPCQSGSSGPSPEVPSKEGGSGSAIYGVQGSSTVKSAWEEVYMDAFNGESDSCWGSNAYSIQLNTNEYTGSNGHTDWDQFVLQNGPNASNNCDNHGPLLRSCIWQNDLTLGGYNYDCVPVPSQALYTGYVSYFNASVHSGNIYFTAEILLGNGTYKSYSVSESESYGLGTNWSTASGTVLGFGGGSEASFTSSATVYADLGVARFTSSSAESDSNTAESNNLAYTYHSYIGCSNNICFEDTTSTV